MQKGDGLIPHSWGFTLDEIHTHVHEFPEETAPSERWQVMARQKLDELDERLRTIEAMKGILKQTLNCDCPTLEECAAGLGDWSPPKAGG